MGRGSEQTFFQRRHTDGQDAREKALNVTHHFLEAGPGRLSSFLRGLAVGRSRGCFSSFAERVLLFASGWQVCLAHAWALVEQSQLEGTPDTSRAASLAPWGWPLSHSGLNSALPPQSESRPRSQPPERGWICGNLKLSVQAEAGHPLQLRFLSWGPLCPYWVLGAGLLVASESQDTWGGGGGKQRVGGPWLFLHGPCTAGGAHAQESAGSSG